MVPQSKAAMVLECIAMSLIPDQATGNLKTMNPLAYVDISRPSHPNLRGAFLDVTSIIRNFSSPLDLLLKIRG